MNILAVDTTTKDASVSLKKDTKMFFNNVNNEITHSEKLLPLINKTLNETSLKLNDIDKFALLNGPGSFTGIRIGLSTIKAFAHVLKKDIISISSLELIAAMTYINDNLNNEKYIISMIDAKNDRFYYSIYKIMLNNEKVLINKVTYIKNDIIDIAISNIKNDLKQINIELDDVIFSGILTDELKRKLSFYKTYEFYPTTNDLLTCIEKIYDLENYTFNAFNLKAIYARPSQAERVKNGDK